MFRNDDINGLSMADKTLCLTYDDGPGEHSLEIARFLHNAGVKATFFVVGKFAVHHKAELAEMSAMGHTIGNHTYEHPDLPYYCSVNGDVQDQIIRTNTLISEFSGDRPVYFRAPYGKWSAEVAAELNRNPKSSLNMLGPIHWDIPGIDCYFWKLGKTVDETVEEYLRIIKNADKGIVVMHDEIADMDIVKAKNKTLELTVKLIPLLLDAGYRFLSLHELTFISDDLATDKRFTIKCRNRKFLRSVDNGFKASGISKNETELHFQMQEHSSGKVSLTDFQNKYFFCNPENDESISRSDQQNEYTKFDYIPVRENGFMLRSFNGNYLGTDNGDVLKANEPYMKQAEIFYFEPLHRYFAKPVSLKQRILLLKKTLRFIKSKLFS